MTEGPGDTHPTRWFWIAAIWGAGALFDATQTVVIMFAEGRHHPWPPLFLTELVSWLPWAFATPLIVDLARRYPITRDVKLRAVALHLTTFAVLTRARSELQSSAVANLRARVASLRHLITGRYDVAATRLVGQFSPERMP